MAATETIPDNRTVRTIDDKVASGHLLFPVGFLAVGAILWLVSMIALRFPFITGGPFSPGRLSAMAHIALVVGWLIPAGSGIVYFLLPRLSGAPLHNAALARLALPTSALTAVAGMVTMGLGLGDGRAPLLLPWWLDLAVMAVATIPLLVTVTTLRERREEGVYVSVWFVAAAAVWLPMIYAATNIPGTGSLGRALSEVVFDAGFATMWVLAIGMGGAFYTVVKITGNPLDNRQMARVAFWSLAFASIWSGPARLALGATADWLDKIAAVLGLALPVAVIAAGAGIVLSIGRSWSQVREDPSLLSIVGGLGLAVFISSLAAAGGFRSVAATVGFTAFWDGIQHGWLLSVGTLLFAGTILHALPATGGRGTAEPKMTLRGIRLMLIGGAGTVITMAIGGVLTGLTWTGASFATGSFLGIADTWNAGLGAGGTLVVIGLVFAALTTVGQILVATGIIRSAVSRKAADHEVLDSDEEEE